MKFAKFANATKNLGKREQFLFITVSQNQPTVAESAYIALEKLPILKIN